SSHDNALPLNGSAGLFSSPSPRTVLYILDCLLDLLEICEIHPFVIWGVMRQMFCYLGGEMFNRVLTTRDFCSRSRAMSIRMNLSHISEWVRTNEKRLVPPPVVKHKQQQQQQQQQQEQKQQADSESKVDGSANSVKTPTEATFPSTESLLYKAFFDPLVELLELLQCLTHLPDLAEYFETTAKMQNLNILQQETLVANYRYEMQEKRIDSEVVSYLESIAKEIRDGQRAEREKQSIERSSRRSTASVFTERRTMDGRPSLFSFDLASSGTRGPGGLVRFSAEPAVNAGLASDISAYTERAANSSSREPSLNIPMSRLSSESAGQSPSISSGMISMQPPSGAQGAASTAAGTNSSRSRTGARTARRGLLLPIARSGSTASSRPSARNIFSAGPASAAGATGIGGSSLVSVGSSRLSESLEPISEASSVMSRQRSHTTIDTVDDDSEKGSSSSRNSIVLSGRLSGEVFGSVAVQPPNTAPVGRGWTKSNASEAEYNRADDLTASLRGPKGKKCLPENMTELLDSTELLPFAVPTSREWLIWWQSQKAGVVTSDGARKQSREWSNETVAYHQNQQNQQNTGQSTSGGSGGTGSLLKVSNANDVKRRSELAPVVPSEFLNALSQIA
ncbi:hypothetical protein J3B02_004626, partial [Coemansia erecta]